ncbi:MAG: hypothetical protein JHD40_01530 [Acidimicrobiia bacterium]|nr:hypothetical protein [Acidimicrobiia bacterium]
MTHVDLIPTAFTPTGGYGEAGEAKSARSMPAPILEGCTTPLGEGVPDLRGTWRVVDVRSNGEPLKSEDPIWSHVERIEQAGNRAIVTGGGVIHDFRSCDGTLENGVHDVMAADYTTQITVAASYEDGVLVLRPEGADGFEVKRWIEGDELVWDFSSIFVARLQRVEA